MRKVLGFVMLVSVMGAISASETPVFAQGGNVPAGDALAQTPPIDVRKKQLPSAPKRFVRRYKRYKGKH